MVSASNGLKRESKEDKLYWVRIEGSDIICRAQKAGGYVVCETVGRLRMFCACPD